MSKKTNNKFNYQESLDRLDKILSDIQSGSVPLDHYEVILKEAHQIIETSRAYLRNLDSTIQKFENDN